MQEAGERFGGIKVKLALEPGFCPSLRAWLGRGRGGWVGVRVGDSEIKAKLWCNYSLARTCTPMSFFFLLLLVCFSVLFLFIFS